VDEVHVVTDDGDLQLAGAGLGQLAEALGLGRGDALVQVRAILGAVALVFERAADAIAARKADITGALLAQASVGLEIAVELGREAGTAFPFGVEVDEPLPKRQAIPLAVLGAVAHVLSLAADFISACCTDRRPLASLAGSFFIGLVAGDLGQPLAALGGTGDDRGRLSFRDTAGATFPDAQALLAGPVALARVVRKPLAISGERALVAELVHEALTVRGLVDDLSLRAAVGAGVGAGVVDDRLFVVAEVVVVPVSEQQAIFAPGHEAALELADL